VSRSASAAAVIQSLASAAAAAAKITREWASHSQCNGHVQKRGAEQRRKKGRKGESRAWTEKREVILGLPIRSNVKTMETHMEMLYWHLHARVSFSSSPWTKMKKSSLKNSLLPTLPYLSRAAVVSVATLRIQGWSE
jgi:hypothetical protein